MIRQQMKQAIDDGIQGYLQSAFAGGKTQPCAVTGYPLTAETSRVRYVMQFSYDALESAFMEHMQWDENSTANNSQLQAWIAYFWQYARLEFVEQFPVTCVSQDALLDIHEQMKALYQRVTSATGEEIWL